MVLVLAFDTETTGLPIIPGATWNQREELKRTLFEMGNDHYPNWTEEVLSNWSHILQISYIMFDTETSNVTEYNKYIMLDDEVTISPDAYKIHHISKDDINAMPKTEKTKIKKALMYFIRAVKKADVIVGHNVEFDRLLVLAELMRMHNSYVEDINEIMDPRKFECTMNLMQNVCNIPMTIDYIDKKTNEKKSFTKIKSPSLSETYKYLFGYTPNDLHNSLYDSIICLRVYCMQKYGIDVAMQNNKIMRHIEDITPTSFQS